MSSPTGAEKPAQHTSKARQPLQMHSIPSQALYNQIPLTYFSQPVQSPYPESTVRRGSVQSVRTSFYPSQSSATSPQLLMTTQDHQQRSFSPQRQTSQPNSDAPLNLPAPQSWTGFFPLQQPMQQSSRASGLSAYPFPYRDATTSASSRSSSESDLGSEHSECGGEPWYHRSSVAYSLADSVLFEPALRPFQSGRSSSSASSIASPIAIGRSGSSTSLQAVKEHSLLDDLDPTPRAYQRMMRNDMNLPLSTNYQLRQPSPRALDPNYASQQSPATTNDLVSPSSSSVSLPELESSPEETFWHDLQQFNLEAAMARSTSQSDLNSSHSSIADSLSQSVSYETLPSQVRSSRSSRQVLTANEPLHWQSQTTTATKQAAIARRKPGSAADFICPYCSESFTRRYNLKGHMLAHNGEKPFACDFPTCTKAFARSHDLKRHRGLHTTSQNRHRCNGCGQRFKRLEGLHKHYRQERDMAASERRQTLCFDSAFFDSFQDPSHSSAGPSLPEATFYQSGYASPSGLTSTLQFPPKDA